MEYLLFLARQPAVAFKLPSFLCHWRVYYCSNLLLIFTLLSLIIEGQAGFITPEAVTGFLQCLPPAGVFAFGNPSPALAQVAQNCINSVTWRLDFFSNTQNWTIHPSRDLSLAGAEELRALQTLGKPNQTGLFLWDGAQGVCLGHRQLISCVPTPQNCPFSLLPFALIRNER